MRSVIKPSEDAWQHGVFDCNTDNKGFRVKREGSLPCGSVAAVLTFCLFFFVWGAGGGGVTQAIRRGRNRSLTL